MQATATILDEIVATMDKVTLSQERSTSIWAQIIEIFAGVLLADTCVVLRADHGGADRPTGQRPEIKLMKTKHS